jgi:putative ABC transport system ATP-binding protein
MLIAKDLTKTYGQGRSAVRAIDRVTIGFDTGAFAAIMGPSGSGKSTLMHCLAGLDTVTSGSVLVGDTQISGLGDRELTLFRRDHIGFIFQSFNLLPALTAEQNIRLPLELAGRRPDPRWFQEVAGVLGLGGRLGHRPSELSGGEQQRVACARALISRPDVIFADEPTGNLDSRSGAEVLTFLQHSGREFGQTVIMVTHDPVAASYAERVVFLADGQVHGELLSPTVAQVLDALKVHEC